ncbi:MAG: hypothetical protein ABJP33_02735 [Pseudoruegeria sp.]
MLKPLALLCFTIMAATSGIAGDAISPGARTLAHLVGVEPGLYTVSQLQQLADAQRENNHSKVKFLLNNSIARGETISIRSVASAGQKSLARQAKVDVSRFSSSELTQLIVARQNGDDAMVQRLLNR